jgi:DNA-binding transcriptional LysR family regulator
VELRHLRYFVAVAEDLHFRKAAERLHVAQPAVSEQVRKLEQELGVKLFNRSQRSVALTTAGAALLEEARHVLRHAKVAQQAARNAGDRATTRLRIGYLPDSLPASVPRALRLLAASAPSVELDLTTGESLRLIEDVRARRLDAVVTTLPAPTSGLRVTALGEQGAVVVLPVTHPRAVDSTIALERLAPERLVVLPRAADPAFHNAVVALCRPLADVRRDPGAAGGARAARGGRRRGVGAAATRRDRALCLPRDSLRRAGGRHGHAPERRADPSRHRQPRDARIPARAGAHRRRRHASPPSGAGRARGMKAERLEDSLRALGVDSLERVRAAVRACLGCAGVVA